MTTCTRCQTTGFLNSDHLPEKVAELDVDAILAWIGDNPDTEAQVCDCCGNGEDWYGEPGCHYHNDDPMGSTGPYAYNGGLCECH